ncbi:MAG: hypothetical protein AVDCRST_MAG11-2151 [uncultured Gemmatimonadaceae bacterium]|uniref:Uncharacterized protein n=1 Tax=uncultured Gemmatimonadaceae bacterium TaxID=246130 RepID=A0A6J4L501_9BACT|nr:MAG: hypothetical protein AVDCRST_MAG11-2151 [uncultured Gemmatimonadaceae bacterium]
MHTSLALVLAAAGLAAAQGCVPAASRPGGASRSVAAPIAPAQPAAASAAPAVPTARASRGADPKEYLFAEVPFGIKPARVTELLEKRGYTAKGVDDDGDYKYAGSMMGAPTMAYAVMGEGRLVRFFVIVGTEDDAARATYAKMRDAMTRKYGRPEYSVEEYDRPYRAGDGREDEAVKKGKARIVTVWRAGQGSAAPSVGIRVTTNLAVSLSYESSAWKRERERRDALRPSDLE